MTTFLVTPEEIAGPLVTVEGESYRHLFRARRLAIGDPLRVVDGAGRARLARVVAVDRRRAVVELGEPAPSREPSLRVELLVAPARPERVSWMVEKVTELGVVAVRLVAAERAPRRFGAGTLERLRRVAGAAVEQCGRSRVPAITGVHAWGELPALVGGLGSLFLLEPGAARGAGDLEASASAGVLVGPEGGWTDAERESLALLDAREICLGERVLRVETAAVVAAAHLLLVA